jgi:DNA-binding PadR family transcriptional regulator
MAGDIRMSAQTLLVLRALLEDPHTWTHGYDIALRTGLKSGTLYPVLMRLADRGWLESRWEQPEDNGRPRHVYRFSSAGCKLARTAVAERKGPYPVGRRCPA